MSHSQAEIMQTANPPIFELKKFLHAHNWLSIFLFRLKDFGLCRNSMEIMSQRNWKTC